TVLAKQYWERRSSDGKDFLFGRISWLQAHLMDYYIGLCAEAKGDVKTAVSSYERVLKNFPTNSSAIRQLAKISPDNLKATNLLAVPFTNLKPLSFFGSSVGIVSVDVKPTEIKALHDKMEIDVTLRMFDSTTNTVDLKAQLSTKQGVFTTIPLSPVDRYQHNSLLWEQGAIIRLHGVLPGVLTRAVIHGKKLNSQYIMIEIIQGLKTQANPRLFIPVPLREATQND
ncbi:MAG: hypothetical protein MJ106_07605, partial [Lentisphaeria bacterium]|nr:hypothetical protein [Lentisphaeria bacterium]